MAKQTINTGTSPNKGDGDPLRTAFGKINNNFDELYAANFAPPTALTSSLIPDTDDTYDLGSVEKSWSDIHVSDFIYLNGHRIELTTNGTLLINGGPPAERQDTMGSVFADDSTVMVDGIAGKVVGPVDTTTVDANTITATSITGALTGPVTGNVTGNVTGDVVGSLFADDSTTMIDGVGKYVNLDGTVKGNIIPDANEAYDIGSMTHKFRDLYLSGSTINLGGVEITNDGGVITFGGEKVVVEGGTGDVKGSVFGDDSTLLVDAVNSVIPKAVVQDSTNWDTAYAWGNHAAAGYLVQADILDGTLTIDVNNTGDLVGSVFGDDSTLLVDAINSVIPKAVVEDSSNWDTAYAWGDHSAAGYQSATAPFTGDVKGSVFGDDSTLLVDAVANKLKGYIETNTIDGLNASIEIVTAGGTSQFKDDGNLKLAVEAALETKYIANYAGDNLMTLQNDAIRLGSAISIIPFQIATSNLGTSQWRFNEIHGTEIKAWNSSGNRWSTLTHLGLTGDVVGSVFGDDSTLLVDAVNGVIPASVVSGTITNTIDTNTINTSSGNLSIVADNYVIIDSANNGQIEIGRASGVGNVIIGNADNGTNVELKGNVTMDGSFTPPMLTQAEIDALTPTLGMMVYNTTTGKFQGYAADANNDSTTGWADLH